MLEITKQVGNVRNPQEISHTSEKKDETKAITTF